MTIILSIIVAILVAGAVGSSFLTFFLIIKQDNGYRGWLLLTCILWALETFFSRL